MEALRVVNGRRRVGLAVADLHGAVGVHIHNLLLLVGDKLFVLLLRAGGVEGHGLDDRRGALVTVDLPVKLQDGTVDTDKMTEELWNDIFLTPCLGQVGLEGHHAVKAVDGTLAGVLKAVPLTVGLPCQVVAGGYLVKEPRETVAVAVIGHVVTGLLQGVELIIVAVLQILFLLFKFLDTAVGLRTVGRRPLLFEGGYLVVTGSDLGLYCVEVFLYVVGGVVITLLDICPLGKRDKLLVGGALADRAVLLP